MHCKAIEKSFHLEQNMDPVDRFNCESNPILDLLLYGLKIKSNNETSKRALTVNNEL